jgi:acyl-[acyl-carrier-protein]-phospholipid O-acyltransferase/long-chain-fatty-acid--[acyl-carrier-protein] ligase
MHTTNESAPASGEFVVPMVLQRRMLRALRTAGKRLKVADSLGTRLSGAELLLRILAARRVLERELDPSEKRVGVFLPPTAGAVIVNAALALSGRVAVNLNYTVSQPILDTCIRLAGLKHVISSPTFLKKVDLTVGDTLLDAATLRNKLTLADKVAAFVQAKLLPMGMLESTLGVDRIQPDDVLTVIFTSGSTGDPKGVVLTVNNVGSNVHAVDRLVHLSAGDVAVGSLPFFHSYGYMATLWIPLALEPACVYHVTPLDAQAIGDLAREHHATILMTTPTFLRTYIRRTPPADFSSLEVVFASAERLPNEVRDAFEKKFGVRPWEAYGATELSPLVAANVPPARHVPGRPVDAREGTVGRPIAGCRARISPRDASEPTEELPVGQEGLLWIRGPNVMQGYLDRPDLTAKVLRDGWYCTGDVAKLDADGFITITGRESRFSKIGGEMVPHVTVEEKLNDVLGATDGQLLAVVAGVRDVRKGERLVVLHLPMETAPREICQRLAEAGLPNLWIPSPDSFVEIDEIPALGSGKLDLKRISLMAAERFAGEGTA